MEKRKQDTIDTYNNSAKLFAERFDKSGARRKDVEEVFAYCTVKNPKVLEIGCANGRDAEIIKNYTDKYTGIDISEELIKIAKNRLPHLEFITQDIESYVFPAGIDIVFAFASLIHSPADKLKETFENIYKSPTSGGLLRISMKKSDSHEEVLGRDVYGERTYYHYSAEELKGMLISFRILKEYTGEANNNEWVEIIAIKQEVAN